MWFHLSVEPAAETVWRAVVRLDWWAPANPFTAWSTGPPRCRAGRRRARPAGQPASAASAAPIRRSWAVAPPSCDSWCFAARK